LRSWSSRRRRVPARWPTAAQGTAPRPTSRWSSCVSTLPDTPTIAESGYPGFEASVWHAFIAPRGTPRATVDKLNAEIRKALAASEVKERLAALGAEVSPSGPTELGALIRAERERYGKLIREAQIKVK
jgi:tripartite-type tricarboxylate transporter receptor subunit TctC